MTLNTRIITHEFDYEAPGSLQAALELLDRHGDNARVLAGGTDLIGALKRDKQKPALVIDISRIAELKQIEAGAQIKIGAGNTFRTVMEYFRSDARHAALFEAIYGIGKTQVLNMGTIGGNISNGSPKADTAPPLLIFCGRTKLASVAGERTVDLQDFFTGPNKTVMKTNEIMTELQFDAFSAGKASAFEKKTRVGADISKISCVVAVERQGDVCVACRIALGAAAPVPMRTLEAEKMLTGKTIDEDLINNTMPRVSQEIKPPARGRITAEYRRHLAGIMFRDVFWKAWQRAGGEAK